MGAAEVDLAPAHLLRSDLNRVSPREKIPRPGSWQSTAQGGAEWLCALLERPSRPRADPRGPGTQGQKAGTLLVWSQAHSIIYPAARKRAEENEESVLKFPFLQGEELSNNRSDLLVPEAAWLRRAACEQW